MGISIRGDTQERGVDAVLGDRIKREQASRDSAEQRETLIGKSKAHARQTIIDCIRTRCSSF